MQLATLAGVSKNDHNRRVHGMCTLPDDVSVRYGWCAPFIYRPLAIGHV
jgi:hypothetical protein